MNKCKSCGKKIRVRHICNTCAKRNWRKNNPLLYAYLNLKHNAKRRGKDFSLTLDQFREFAILTDYVTKKGLKTRSYTIDRIDPQQGYHIDNIQVITNRANIKKVRLSYIPHVGFRAIPVSSWANAPPSPDSHDDDLPF